MIKQIKKYLSPINFALFLNFTCLLDESTVYVLNEFDITTGTRYSHVKHQKRQATSK